MQKNVPTQTLPAAEINGIRLNVKAFAATCGLIWEIGLFVLTWWIMAFDGATGQATLIGQVYRGYHQRRRDSLCHLRVLQVPNE
jgi:hypothetical protein